MNKIKVDQLHFKSDILGKDMALSVYLPDCCENNTALPVLYFLHGRSGDEQILFDAAIGTTADRLIRNGEIDPLIIVCPRIENSRGINSSTTCKDVKDSFGRTINLGMYEDYLIKEIIPLIDTNYNTLNNRAGRFIGGASAGGYAALHQAFRHQDLFIKAGGHMPALELELQEEDKPYFQDRNNWEKYDPITIAQHSTLVSDLQVYLDAGNEDEGAFYKGCFLLHSILEEKGINTQNHVFNGHHSVEYIQSNMDRYLRFYGKKNAK